MRSVFLTGDGPTFCSGGDFKMLQTACDPWPVHRRFRNLSRWLVPLITLDKPVVVGVRGHAVGGGMGLALTGDVVIAGESAKFMSGFFRLGTVPDIGTMYHLPRLIGMARAKNFLFSGATMSAKEALELGLVAKVVAGRPRSMRPAWPRPRALPKGPAEVMGLAKTLMARSFETSLARHVRLRGVRTGAGHVQPGVPRRAGAAIESAARTSWVRRQRTAQPSTRDRRRREPHADQHPDT